MMNHAEQSESSMVARLIVAAVALSSLVAGTTIVGGVIEVAAPAQTPIASATPAPV